MCQEYLQLKKSVIWQLETSHFWLPANRASAHLLLGALLCLPLSRDDKITVLETSIWNSKIANHTKSPAALLNMESHPLAILCREKTLYRERSSLKSDVFKKWMDLDLKCNIKPSCSFVRCIIFSCLILSSLSLSGASGKGVIENLNKTVLLSLPRSLLLIEVESVLMGAAFLAMLIVRLSSSSSSLWRLYPSHHLKK